MNNELINKVLNETIDNLGLSGLCKKDDKGVYYTTISEEFIAKIYERCIEEVKELKERLNNIDKEDREFWKEVYIEDLKLEISQKRTELRRIELGYEGYKQRPEVLKNEQDELRYKKNIQEANAVIQFYESCINNVQEDVLTDYIKMSLERDIKDTLDEANKTLIGESLEETFALVKKAKNIIIAIRGEY